MEPIIVMTSIKTKSLSSIYLRCLHEQGSKLSRKISNGKNVISKLAIVIKIKGINIGIVHKSKIHGSANDGFSDHFSLFYNQ